MSLQLVAARVKKMKVEMSVVFFHFIHGHPLLAQMLPQSMDLGTGEANGKLGLSINAEMSAGMFVGLH